MAILQSQHHLQEPDCGNGRKQQGVEIADANRFKASSPQDIFELSTGVSAEVMVGDIVAAPQPGQCRNGHQQPAVRRELSGKPCETFHILLDVLDHVKGRNNIIGAWRKWYPVRQHSGFHINMHLGAGNVAGFVVEFKGIQTAEFRQHLQIAARAAASLEQAQPGVARDVPGNNRLQDLAARAEPPVVAFELIEAFKDVPFHVCEGSFRSSSPRISRTK